jgi:hypothetical protein
MWLKYSQSNKKCSERVSDCTNCADCLEIKTLIRNCWSAKTYYWWLGFFLPISEEFALIAGIEGQRTSKD